MQSGTSLCNRGEIPAPVLSRLHTFTLNHSAGIRPSQ
jgi:hypothetical protein